MNRFINHISKYCFIIIFLGILLSALFINYNILLLKIIIYVIDSIGVLLCGYNIGNSMGARKKR